MGDVTRIAYAATQSVGQGIAKAITSIDASNAAKAFVNTCDSKLTYTLKSLGEQGKVTVRLADTLESMKRPTISNVADALVGTEKETKREFITRKLNSAKKFITRKTISVGYHQG